MPVSVRRQRSADAASVRAVLTDAFGTSVATLAEDLRRAMAQIALVAERNGEIVGSITLSRSWLDADRELVDVLVLSPLGVATAHQRTGVGSALVRAALTAAEASKTPLIFLEGVPDYYPRFGFVRGAALGFTPPSRRVPDLAFQVATLTHWRPWMTGALIYCDAFWRHDFVGLRHRNLTQGSSSHP